MFSVKPFKSLTQLLAAFPNEQSVIDHLEFIRWNGNVVSPFDPTSKVYKCKGNKYRCLNTKKYFNVRTNSIFENSKIPLQTWLMAIYLFTTSKRGISSYTMADQLGITQKSSWFLLSRIRYAMDHPAFAEQLSGEVESDESFFGGKNKNRHHDKKVEKSQGRSFKDKTPVLGLVERSEYTIVERPNKNDPIKKVKEKNYHKISRVKCQVVENTGMAAIQPHILKIVEPGSALFTDEWQGYNGMDAYYDHEITDHSKGQYVNGDASTNRCENFWSQMKRSIIGVYYKTSRKHLQKYADEMSFRFNFRTNSISEKLDLFLQSASTKRLSYKMLINGY
ncbi:IS1595 family transposase [Taibaiella helva]|uniref:IS1595 family transposase n=1 Tax=Taibaiella helva TaxID=2301235 RepID=UPI000E581AF3|nr:IS1595 family transposase [Taibaiella helva]